MDLDRKLKRVSGRNWEDIRSLWVPHMPKIVPPGSRPNASILELNEFKELLPKISSNGEHREPAEWLCSPSIGEGIYLLHKASHAISAAETHVTNGRLTWSSVSAYHGSLYAAKVILRFLGIGAAQISNKTILYDLWTGPRKGKRKQMESRYRRGTEVQFLEVGRLEQRHWWEIFQKIIEGADVRIWDQNTVEALLRIDSRAYASHRNKLIYGDDFWMLDDLTREIRDGEFARGKRNPRVDQADFSLMVAFALLSLAVSLLDYLNSLSPILRDETGLIIGYIKNERHEIFSSVYPL